MAPTLGLLLSRSVWPLVIALHWLMQKQQEIAITGSHGFVGSYLLDFFPNSFSIPRSLEIPDRQIDVVINLAGANIFSRRWTPTYKKEIYTSRVDFTKRLVEKVKPKLFISASAVGYYGNRGDEALTEDASKGEGFLSDVCRDWEEALAGTPTCNARFGIVMDKSGGALKRLLQLFNWGLGSRLFNGEQYMSWIALSDLAGAMQHVINQQMEGPVNFTSPHPIQNKDLTKTLAKATHRWTLPPAPEWALELILGEGARTLFDSQRVIPKKLLDSGFSFAFERFDMLV